MIRLDLSEDEVQSLREMLRNYLGDLGMEIGSTRPLEYRRDLKQTKERLLGLLRRLEEPSRVS